jgi:hypothetical protein
VEKCRKSLGRRCISVLVGPGRKRRGAELKIRQAAKELRARGRRGNGGRGEEVAGAGDERVAVVGRRRRRRQRAVARGDPRAGAGRRGAGVGRGRCCPEDGAELVEPADAAGVVEGQRREQPARGGRRQRGRHRGQDAGVARGAERRRQGAVVGAVARRRRGHGAHGALDGGQARGRGHGGGRREQQLGGQERLPQRDAAGAAAVVVHHVALVLLRRRRRRAGPTGACEVLHERHEVAGLDVDDLGRRVVDDDGRPPGGRNPRSRVLLDGVRLRPDVELGRARALQLPARRGGAARRRWRVHPPRPVPVLRHGGGVGEAVVEERGAGIGPGMGIQHEGKGRGEAGTGRRRSGVAWWWGGVECLWAGELREAKINATCGVAMWVFCFTAEVFFLRPGALVSGTASLELGVHGRQRHLASGLGSPPRGQAKNGSTRGTGGELVPRTPPRGCAVGLCTSIWKRPILPSSFCGLRCCLSVCPSLSFLVLSCCYGPDLTDFVVKQARRPSPCECTTTKNGIDIWPGGRGVAMRMRC